MEMFVAVNDDKDNGFWLDVDSLSADEIKEKINEFLAENDAEDWIVVDYDDMPDFGEHPNLDSIEEFVADVDSHGYEVAEAAFELGVSCDNYYGYYESKEDLGYDWIEATGEIPDHLSFYFDYEALGRDLAMDFVEHNGYYFRA